MVYGIYMNEILIVMTLGMIIGYLLRKNEVVFQYVDKIIMGTIFLLLFCLGLSVGLNEKVIANFHLIGLNALLLTSGAIAGSIGISWGVYLLFFRRRNHEK